MKKKCGYAVIVGAPNSGKSTLTNAITGQKVSIVSPKVQTTRSRITGIKTHKNSQIILIDTPGIFHTKGNLDNKLNRAIVKTARNSIEVADVVIFIVDAKSGIKQNDKLVLEYIKNMPNKILVINKVDLVSKIKLLELATEISTMAEFNQVFMISASKNDGVDDLENYLAEVMPAGEWNFPEDQISEAPLRFLAAEITREKLFLNLDTELPYNLYVETEKYEDLENSAKIHQIIYTKSEGHKKIIIGNKGSRIKKIGEESRKDIAKIVDKKVHLFLFVKVRENWFDTREAYVTSGIDV